ncbi:hypothetical protein J4727_13725 [Providencia rettgeri]|uniref:Uncharacterized protein n=1 Tax=Providencia rettgeri TaxID=587 RepID=A0A939NEX4_PRORE|nr:hypothetical protein [Providencia rettgeri]
MKKIALLLLLFSSFTVAKSNYHGNHPVMICCCTCLRFISFSTSMQKLQCLSKQRDTKPRRCELGQGQGSIFCKAQDAKCSTSKLSFGDQYIEESLIVYAKSWQGRLY